MVAGFNDGGNLLAAASASRVIPPPLAFLIITLGALLGPLVAGTGVAETIGHGIIDYGSVGFVPLIASIAGATVTLLLAYIMRFPVSASVALVSASIGSVWVLGESHVIMWSGVGKVVVSLFGSILVGFVVGALIYTVAVIALRNVRWQAGHRLMYLQYLTVGLLAAGYGSNDAEKMMGLIVAATLIGVHTTSFTVPLWVIALSVGAFATGMAIGGLRIARTIGGKLFHIRSLHALSFQTAAAATVLTASSMGGPLSTTETTASAIMGVGTASNPRALRWRVAGEIVLAWLLTAPISLIAGATATVFFRTIFHGAR